MNKVTMTLIGLDALKAAVARCPDVVRTHLGDVVQKTSYAIAQRARTLAPVATGALKASIESTSRGMSGRVGVSGVSINGQRPEVYWRFVEFGTVKMAARPLFRGATEAETPGFEQRIRAIAPKIERDFSAGGLT